MNERLDVLVLHGIRDLSQERRTSVRHLFALQRYTHNHRLVYHHRDDPITDALRSIHFDVIVLDATFLSYRWIRPRQAFVDIRERYDEWLRGYGAVIAAFPQDDFDHATYLDEWLSGLGTDVLFSVYRQHWHVLYPRLIASGAAIIPSLAGYIDEDDVLEYHAMRKPFRDRTSDVGYRVNRLPANFGRFGVIKSEFGRSFARSAANRARCDISDDPKDSLYGELWPRFLGDCRFILGSEAGSSVLDPIGEVQDRVKAFTQENPGASFEEIATACLQADDEALTFPAVSPRLFEAAMAGNCPILVEGEYGGLIAPEDHFISVKRDFSDIESAVDRLADLAGAEAMAARFEKAIFENSALRYKTWVKTIVEPALVERSETRYERMSDWEFAFRLEQHRSAMGRIRADEVALNKEQTQAFKNAANTERLRLVRSVEEQQHLIVRQQELIDQLSAIGLPLARAIASRLKSKLFS